MEMILGLFVGIVFFSATVGAYTLGIKHGKIIKNDGVPSVNPVEIIKDKKAQEEAQKVADDLTNQINNMLTFGEVNNEK